VIIIPVPTLNERTGDIPLLAEHFIELICNEHGMAKKKITDDAIKELQKRTWTGNIREFRNVMERLIILCDREISGKDVAAFA
jgi:two-component system nitrogen regulation response regulator NtrX